MGTENDGVSAPMVLDRMILDSCGESEGWGEQTCSAPPPPEDSCKQEEMINSIVTGCLSATGAWILVGFTYTLCKGRSSPKEYESLVESDKPNAPCTSTLLLILCGIAVGGACLCSWASTQLLNAIMRSTECFDFDEVLVAILAAGICAAVSIVLSLQWLARGYPDAPHPLLGTKAKEAPPPGKLLLVEVPDGAVEGHMLSGDIFQSGGSFTSSYGTGTR